MSDSSWDDVHSHSMDRWVPSRGVVEMSSPHGMTCYRQCGSFATKLSRLDACENRKVVRWCRTQASGHKSQGVVGGSVNEVGISIAAPDWTPVACCWMDQGSGGCSQRCCFSVPVRASKPPQECNSWWQLFVKWLKMSAIRGCSAQRYSKVAFVDSEKKGSVSLLWLTFSSRLASLLLRWKTANTAFVVLSFNCQVWRYSPKAAMSLLRTPSTVCQSPSVCMTARSLAYAINTNWRWWLASQRCRCWEEEGCHDGSLCEAIFEAS